MSSSAPIHHYMDFYEDFYKKVGSKIRFKTNEGEYEGLIKYVYPKRQRVTIEDVHYVPTDEYMGKLDFFFREFLSYSVVKSDDRYDKWDYLSRILDRSFIGKQYQMSDVLNEDLDEESVSGESIPCADEMFRDDFVLHLPENLEDKLPHDCLILENIDTEFNQSIDYISQQKVIGVSFEGPKISRHGKLSWVCISTPYCVFLFDIEFLGKEAFDKGLRNIFQDKMIEKVIHDCRQPADCLFNLFGTELVNVFDTQVADFVVNMQRYTDKPAWKRVSSLDCCLVVHLDVPQEFLYNRETHLSYASEVTFFHIRPINDDFRNVVIKNVVYLVLLKEILAELLLSPFRKAVDVYLNVLSEASEPELLLDVSVPEMIPPALLMQGIQTVRFQEVLSESPAVPLVCHFKNSEKDTPVDCNKLSNMGSKDISSEKPDNCKNFMIVHKNSQAVSNHLSIVPEKNAKSVIIEEIHFQSSKMHMDNTYHRLANSLADSSNIVELKPSHISNFTVKKSSFSRPAAVQNTSELHKAWETVSDCSSDPDISSDTSTDSSDIWAKFRADFSASSYVSLNEKSESSKKKLCFLPAGM